MELLREGEKKPERMQSAKRAAATHSQSTSWARGPMRVFLPFPRSVRTVLGDAGPAQHSSLRRAFQGLHLAYGPHCCSSDSLRRLMTHESLADGFACSQCSPELASSSMHVTEEDALVHANLEMLMRVWSAVGCLDVAAGGSAGRLQLRSF